MTSIGTGYDLSAATFSPDGRIFQVEYAQKAVDNSGTVIALRGKNGIVTAVDKVVTSKMFVKNANPRVFNANDQIGMTFCGTYPDCRSLKDYADGQALDHLETFREPEPIHKLADELANFIHQYTLTGHRPFGTAIFLTSWDEKSGGHVYFVEPSGLNYEYRAWAAGKHRQAAKAEIEKLKFEDMDVKELVKEAAKIIIAIRDENKDKDVEIEMGWVGSHTNGKHETVPSDIVKDAEKWANEKLEEEEDMDED